MVAGPCVGLAQVIAQRREDRLAQDTVRGDADGKAARSPENVFATKDLMPQSATLSGFALKP
jgi:hypothetical protein